MVEEKEKKRPKNKRNIKRNKKQLMIPHTLDNNDMRFGTNQGFNSGDQFYTYLKDSFDALYKEGNSNPKMMSVGLHCRITGRPARSRAVQRFLEYASGFPDVWFARRDEIASHWLSNYNGS